MRFLALVGLLALIGATSAYAAEDDAPLPEIRHFDIETIEMLGQAMYAQDQLAWVATDVVIAERGEAGARAEGMRGWISVEEDDQNIVRFVRLGDDGPEALYDVVFVEGAEPQLYPPATPVLTEEELAQYNARRLALENVDVRCSERYNNIALRDPESGSWLAWALAATTEPDVVITSGHYRFTISDHGLTIERSDRLFRDCPIFVSSLNAEGEESAATGINQVISTTPLETHVFTSLNYQMPL